MKQIHIKKPNIRGFFQKIKNLNKEDIKASWQAKKARREHILEQRRNSKFAKKNAAGIPGDEFTLTAVSFPAGLYTRISLSK